MDNAIPASPHPAPAPSPAATPDPSRRRGGVFGPVVLIAFGVLFLASNLGLLGPLSFLQLASLWPLLLILAGIDLAVGRRWPLAALGLDAVAIVVALALVIASPGASIGGFRFSTGAGAPAVSVPRTTATSLDLRVAGGAARWTLTGGATALVEATATGDVLKLPENRRSGDVQSVRIDQTDIPFAAGRTDVQVRVASDVPVSIRFDAGAGEFILDLRNVKAKDVRVSVGASSLRLILPKPEGDVPVRITAGASSAEIEVPDGVEARIVTTGGLSDTKNLSSRLTGGSDLVTSGYAGARDRVSVTVSAGASSVTVR